MKTKDRNYNCRFCGKLMLPVESIFGESDMQVSHAMWECHACPATVKQYPDDNCWFSIMAFYGGHWYEVMQMYVCADCKEEPLLSIFKYTMYFNENDEPQIKSEFVMEISEDGHITPENVHQKLATLLVFS